MQVFLAQFLPEMLDGIDFWTLRRLKERADIFWHAQPFGAMPACLIDLHDKKVVSKVSGHLS